MKLFVKNMVCRRCILSVEEVFNRLQLPVQAVELGEVEVAHEPTAKEREELHLALNQLGFELIDDRKSRIIEKVKTVLIALIHGKEPVLKVNLSHYLQDQLAMDYHSLSHLFSEVEGTTIEQYYIAQRIERVKELLVYDELTLSEIAYHMGYSSVAHLSGQFKKVTGLTPSHFKKVKENKRRPLDSL